MHRYFFLCQTVRFCFSMNQNSIFTHRLTKDSQIFVDALSFVPPSLGRNVSTCCIISATRLENFKVIIGPFNKEETYTSQFNPIEEFFSALKSNYHRIRSKPQTTHDLVINLTNLLDTIQRENPIEWAGFYDHMINFLNLAYLNLEFCYLI
ncbi:hypothetical protein HZS_5619 [Henneguya salminicola]|nr:hypothetical protein HZS_5619 [Henneguya salminicola]